MVGDSLIHWAGHYAQEQGRENLGLPHQLDWMGVRGMHWEQFTHKMQLKVLFSEPPKVIFIHLGGNDIELLTVCRIMNKIKSGFRYMRAAFPDCQLVWVDILPRLVWASGSPEDCKRRRLNRHGRLVASSLKGHQVGVEIDNTTPGFFRPDGIHLSQVGLEMMLDNLRDAVIRVFSQ